MLPISKPQRSFRFFMALLALALLAPGTGVVRAGEFGTSSFPEGIRIAISPQEKAQHDIHVPPKKPGKRPQLTKQEKLELCARNPQCRANLEAANQGKHPQPIPPVVPGSPEDKAHRLPVPPKAQPPKGPRSELQPQSSLSLLSWLNPFSVSEAEAQTPPPGFPLRAEAPFYIVPGKLEVRNYGGMTRGGDYYLYTSWPGPANITGNNGRNYIPFYFNAPAQGYYIIDVTGTPARAHVNIPWNVPKPYDYQDFSNLPAGTETHYAHLPYLAAGGHWFYFWIDAAPGNSVRIDAVEVDFYRY